jgi:hypothetical protein
MSLQKNNEFTRKTMKKETEQYIIIGIFTGIIFFGIWNIIDFIKYSSINLPVHIFVSSALASIAPAIWVIFIIDLYKKKIKTKQSEKHAG